MSAVENAFQQHDHRHCSARAMKNVRQACASRGLRLTDARQRVLEILLEGHRALGAYEILDRLGEEGRAAQPPVVYRALDFLVAHGFAHRLERLNAFMACAAPRPDHQAMFLICETCRHVAEAPLGAVEGAIRSAGHTLGFQAQSASVEILGLCPGCREAVA